MEKYVSFCADDKGILFQTLFDSVNTEFQECTEIEEPSTQKDLTEQMSAMITLILKTAFFPDRKIN